MNTIIKYSASLVVCLLLSSGCATLYTNSRKPNIYGGTILDCTATFAPSAFLQEYGDIEDACCLLSMIPLALLDLPFSFAADTILLPWTITETEKIRCEIKTTNDTGKRRR